MTYRTPVLLSALGGALMLGLAGALWARFGGEVFLDLVAGGLVGCFF